MQSLDAKCGLPMTQSFVDFLEENKIPLEFFSKSVEMQNDNPRYIRLKPNAKISEGDLEEDLKCKVENVPWIANVFAIPNEVKISSSNFYQKGTLYGIDLSSAAVVEALSPRPEDHVLDLCCCPGAKLCFIADKMRALAEKSSGEEEKIDESKEELKAPKGSLTGVDINENRLKVCKSILKKYGHADFISLTLADGVSFKPEPEILYDKVLVDVECTHEGSLKHLLKFAKTWQETEKRPAPDKDLEKEDKKVQVEESKNESQQEIDKEIKPKKLSKNEIKRRKKQQEENNKAKRSNLYLSEYKEPNNWGVEDFNERFLDPKKLSNLQQLQKGLIRNAYKLTKPGGIFIYSTCSFVKAQNEDIVDDFLKELNENQQRAFLIDVFDENLRKSIPCSEGYLEKTVRFDPINSKSGGMFIAKFRKV